MYYNDFVRTTDISTHELQFYLDGMNEENGEISGVLKRVRRGDFGKEAKREVLRLGVDYVVLNHPDIKIAIMKEIGDRHWYTTRFLQEIGETWESVEALNMIKLGTRKDKDMIMGHRDERENLIDSETKKKQ